MTKSESIKNLAHDLNLFQSIVQPVKKEAENPYFKSKYADLASILEAIKEPMAKCHLSFTQFPSGNGGLTTILMHDTGEWIEETFSVQITDSKPQTVGSAITYMRRYAIGAILGIATEADDDGNASSQPEKKAYKSKYRNDKPTGIATDYPPFGEGAVIED